MIAIAINTNNCSDLPFHIAPYKVHFGQKPHWIREPPLEETDSDNSTDSDNDNEYVRDKPERLVLQKATKIANH